MDNVQSVAPMSEEECLHQLRVSIDADIQSSSHLFANLSAGKREIALVKTKLQEAKMWCGKVLEELGTKLPEQFRDEAK